MVDVLASLEERVKSHKKGIGGQFPFLIGLLLVFEIGLLEFATDIDCSL